MILGRQVGAVEAAEKTPTTGIMYRHNVESFRKMWNKIRDDLGIKFTVKAKLVKLDSNDLKFQTDDSRRLWFVVSRA